MTDDELIRHCLKMIEAADASIEDDELERLIALARDGIKWREAQNAKNGWSPNNGRDYPDPMLNTCLIGSSSTLTVGDLRRAAEAFAGLEASTDGEGFVRGLEAAAKWHDDCAANFRAITSDETSTVVEKNYALNSMLIHENSANHIRALAPGGMKKPQTISDPRLHGIHQN